MNGIIHNNDDGGAGADDLKVKFIVKLLTHNIYTRLYLFVLLIE